MGVRKPGGENQQPPPSRLDAPMEIQKLCFTAFFYGVQVEHGDESAVGHIAAVFKMPLVESLSWSGSLELAVEMEVSAGL